MSAERSEDNSLVELSDKQLADKAYNNGTVSIATARQDALLKHFAYAEKELLKTGVNRQMLWIEYKEKYPDGYTYRRYCHHFSIFLKHADVSMHLEYEAGDIIMIDFAGKKLSYIHPDTAEIISCEIFIAILPYHSKAGLIILLYVDAVIEHVFGCVPGILPYFFRL